MLKLLYFGDFHSDEKSPNSRIDNFAETRKSKIKEILSIAKKEKVIAMIQPGDFLNRPKLSNSYLSELKKDWGFTDDDIENVLSDVLLKNKSNDDLINAIETCNRIPIIGTIGNHELIGNSLKTYSDCSISQLVECGFIRLVDKENPIILKDTDGSTVAITGSPFHLNIDGDDKSSYIIDEKLGDIHIHMVHGMLMDKNFGKKFEHTTVQEIIYKTKADLTLNGHDHIGYEPIYLDGKISYNPGAPVRLSAEKKEMTRKPKVVIIEIDKGTINLKDIYLESAKEGSKVLSREHIDRKKIKSSKVAQMQSVINKAKLDSSIDITDILKNIARNKSLPNEVVEESVNLILKEMGKVEPFNPKGEYYITSLELINFESHAHSFFEFKEGLNILTGQSTHGKSSVIRALSEVFLGTSKITKSKGNSKKSIRCGETFFKIIVTTSHGYEITRIFENKPKGKNKNGWEIYDPNTGEIEYVNTRGLSKVQEILGFNNINLSEKNSVGINFIIQGQSWFFIGDGMTSPDKAKLLGVPFGAQFVDAVLKDVNAKSKKVVSEINFIEENINELDSEINKFTYLNQLEEILNKSMKIKEEIDNLNDNISKLEDLISRRDRIQSKIITSEKIISILDKNNSIIKDKLSDLKSEAENINKIESLIIRKNKVLKAGKEMANLSNSLSSISNLNNELNLIKDSYDSLVNENTNLNKAKRLEEKKELIIRKGNLARKIVKALTLKDDYNINKIKEESDKINKMETSIKDFKELNKKHNIINKKILLIENLSKSLDLSKYNKELDTLKADVDKTEKIDKLIKEKEILSDKIKKEEVLLDKTKEDKELLLLKMKNTLKDMGTCPVCHSDVDDEHINKIISSYK